MHALHCSVMWTDCFCLVYCIKNQFIERKNKCQCMVCAVTKISPVGDWRSTSLDLGSGHMAYRRASSLRISGHLPAPIVNGGGDRFWKWKEFKLWRARDLDLGSGHTAYRRASLIDLYLYTKFHWNRRNFLWTDGRTYGRTFPPPSNIIRSTFGSRPKIGSQNCLYNWCSVPEVKL